MRSIVTYTLYFASALNSETIIGVEMLGTHTQCHTFVIDDDAGQKTRLNPTNSILFEDKHHYRNFDRSLKNFDWILHRL